MTLPTRPAPAPPGSRGQVAAATANASLEQLRLQLQQQEQYQQHQNVTVPKLTIKLPPPPKGPNQNGLTSINGFSTTNNNNAGSSGGGGSITRKFPQARYAPATNWDDSPFDILSGNGNGNIKKQPPPRPPPPKIQPKKHLAPNPSTVQQPTSILSNIFHRKKSSRAPTPNSASRIYGAATYGTTTSMSSSSSSSFTNTSTSTSQITQHNSWNSAWNTQSLSTSTNNHSTTTTTSDAQLISFDSPPSSPTFTQKSNSDCLSVDSFSSDSNFSSPNNGSVSQPESGFEDDFSAAGRSRPATTSPLDPWETIEAFGPGPDSTQQPRYGSIGTAPVRNLNTINTRLQTNGDNPLCNGKSLLPPAPALNMPTIIKPKISQKPKAPKPPTFTKPYGVSLCSDLPTPPSPPMPQCAPPPPPPTVTSSSLSYTSSSTPTVSLLDVISGKADALQLYPSAAGQMDNYGTAATSDEQPYGIALYDFQSTEEGDLCFRENEKIYLLEKASDTWFKGRTRSGCEGIFPANYIEIKVPLSSSSNRNISNNHQPSTTNYSSTSKTYPTSTITNNDLTVRSLYNFPAEVDGDLDLKENDMVTILYRINEDWLYGEVNGRQGQFPANFLEYVPSNIPMP
ncbi:SH3 domain-containing lethal (3) 05822 [Haematobia irritans]|uniref:SH3 domain-containing lethal (3) 05822 n=1 Tax=Haematobia irritans TaxID=7368 RepID=UPI003F4FDED1